MSNSDKATERVRVTLVHIEKGESVTTSRDGGRYYYLPGADYAETEAVLRKAGFQSRDRIMDAVNDAAEQQHS